MDLYIIRHAQSANNALLDERDRVCDPELTEIGRKQAELLAEYLATGHDLHPQPTRPWNTPVGTNGQGGFHIDHLFTSAMHRCLQTALPVSKACGLIPEVWIDLHEHGGIWLDQGPEIGRVGYGGMTRSQVLAEFPDYAVPEQITEEGWWRGGFEPLLDAQARAARVAGTFRAWSAQPDKSNQRIAIITHGAFGTLLIRALLGESTVQPVFYHLDNTSISLLRFRRENELSVRYLNRLDHLPREMVT